MVQSGEGRDTVIDGFVIRNGDRPGGAGGGIYCFNASPTIRNNVFHGNKADLGAAIGCLAGAAPAILDNVIYDNLATGSPGGAIYVQANAQIIGNTLDENQGTPSSGITARFNARPIVSRNIYHRQRARGLRPLRRQGRGADHFMQRRVDERARGLLRGASGAELAERGSALLPR